MGKILNTNFKGYLHPSRFKTYVIEFINKNLKQKTTLNCLKVTILIVLRNLIKIELGDNEALAEVT